MRTHRGTARLAAALAATLVLLRAPTSQAAGMTIRKTGIGVHDAHLTLSLGFQDLFREEDKERLFSGFVTRVLIRVALYRVDRRELVAETYQASEIAYDLWDETFRVTSWHDESGPEHIREAKTPAGAIQLGATLNRFPLLRIDQLEPGIPYRLSFRADLNPLSEELVADVRRWLVRPLGRGNVGSGEGFFGSLVKLFVNPRIEESERRVQVFSQVFAGPEKT